MKSMPVIRVENLSKSYDVYRRPQDMILEVLTKKSHHDTFWALQNITFEVQEKQRIGIIGPNGAGKSTLLKILTGNTTATSGKVEVNGKISALLSMASSLNPEESGLENIKFNLLLNGVPQKKIAQLSEEIVEFAELGSFIYSPVKTYSTGMNARLSFGIATAMEPEIMIVDEILSVGDGYFVNKAYKRMRELVENGKALVFVAHNINEVRRLCDIAIWLESGTVRKIGPAKEVCDEYEQDYLIKTIESTREGNKLDKLARLKYGTAEQLLDKSKLFVRIVPNNDRKIFKDTHFIRQISYRLNSNDYVNINLTLEGNTEKDAKATLDLFGSEWGRMYSRHSFDARSLSSRSGKNWGGQIVFDYGELVKKGDKIVFEINLESASFANNEELMIEYLNPHNGEWRTVDILTRDKVDKEWIVYKAQCTIAPMLLADNQSIDTDTVSKLQADIELSSIELIADSKPTFIVYEKQPFQIDINLKANKLITQLAVHLEINRTDGLYMFWQASASGSECYQNVDGYIKVSFIFDQNMFSEGDYFVEIVCTEGFNEVSPLESKVLLSLVNAMQFSVKRSFPYHHMGLINQKVPVKYQQISGKKDE
jgi:ABC-type polysaccharide/polyol phosphate transport system ATPase subunit